ncbi:MFS transporter, partial [Bacillus sp. HC-Mk]
MDDHGNLIGDSHPTQRLYSEDTPLNGIFLGNWMLKGGHNIIGEPTTTLFRKELLTEPFGTLKERQYSCSVDMASWISLLIYGAGTATNLQARYAGTDLADKKQRATAVSITMVMTTFGAVAGPNLVGVMGSFAHSIGVPKLAGPFILSAAAFILAGLVLFVMLR